MVSIVVPVYNAENYLKKCVDSLIQQTYKDIEIILVNDGSTDSSLSICHEYQKIDDRISVIDKENGGASSARNAGIKAAKGDYIMFADSDDFTDKEWVNLMVASQMKYKDSFVVCDLCGFIHDGTLLPLHKKIIDSGFIEAKDYYILSDNNLLNQPVNKIFSLSIIKENSLVYDTNLVIGEDLYFNLNYLEYCRKIFFINHELYFCLTDRDDSLCHAYYEDLFQINKKLFFKHIQLFEALQVEPSYYDDLYLSFYGSCIDCLDRELNNSEKNFFDKYKQMKFIMKSPEYNKALIKCRSQIDSKRFFVLKSNSPFLYLLYYRVSRMR